MQSNQPSARAIEHFRSIKLIIIAMAAASRKAPASGAAVLASAAVVVALLAQAVPAAALVPYGRGLAWDLLDDPFRVLEQSPFSAVSAAPSRVAGGAGVALARCDWKENPDAHVISVDVPACSGRT